MQIRIKKGYTYGYKENPSAAPQPKRYEDGALVLPEDKAARLLKKGVAELVVDETKAAPSIPVDTPNMDMTKKELLAIAAEKGVEVPPEATKKQIIAALSGKSPDADADEDGAGEEETASPLTDGGR